MRRPPLHLLSRGRRYFTRGLCYRLSILQILILTAAALEAQGTNEPLTCLSQVRALPLSDGPKHLPFKVQATVTYCDPVWRVMFVQEGADAVYVERKAPSNDPSWQQMQSGTIINLEGVTSSGIVYCHLSETNLVIKGQGSLPSPLKLSSDDPFGDTNEGTWVSVTGFISGVETAETKSLLYLTVRPNRILKVYVMNGNPELANALIGVAVEVTGVFAFNFDSNHRWTSMNVLLLSDFSGIRQIRPIPVMSIGELLALKRNQLPDSLVRVRGNVVSQRLGEFLTVRDDSGTVRVNFGEASSYAIGSPVEVFGYPSYENNTLVLRGISVGAPNSASEATKSPMVTQIRSTTANTNLVELTHIDQIRNLTAAEAARGYPVRIIGVVTYNDTNGATQFIQNDTGGIFVDLKNKKFDTFPDARQIVEILGFSGPGSYAPVIEAVQVRVLGESTFPTAKIRDPQALMTGSEDSQWVTLNGVVRSQSPAGNDATLLTLSTGDAQVNVYVPYAAEAPPPRNYVNTRIKVQGVCATIFDNQRQLQDIQLYAPDWKQILVEETAPEDASALPLRPISELLQFHSASSDLHRSRVRGVVLLRQADGSFFLQDATGGILIQPPKTAASIKAGDTVELMGFPSLLNKLPVLQEAMVIKQVSGGTIPEPAELSVEMPLKEGFHGSLVSLEGRILGHSTSVTEELLTLQFGPWITEAVLEKENPEDQLARILPGSVVKLKGVYAARLDDNRRVQSFQLLLRSPADITVVSRPPWWTVKNLLWVLGGLAVMLLLVLAWVSLLRKEVQQRTSELRTEIEGHKHTENLLKTEIVQRRQIEEALQWSEAQLDVILESTADGILAVDNKGKVIKANKRFTELWRIPQSIMATGDDQALLNFVLKQLSDPDAFLKKVQSLYSTGAVETDTLAFKDGRIFERYTSPMMGKGIATGRVWAFRDVTQRKRQEKELSDKNAELERFTYTVSHDLRSPLVTVNTFLSYLEQDLTRPDKEKIRQDVAYMRTAANKMGQLLEELLNLARIGRKMNPPERITFKELAQEVVRLVAGRISKGGVEVQVADADVVLKGDCPRLMEVWQNLVENACKFMGNQPKPRIEIGVEKHGSDVVFFVRDNGMGIDPRCLEKVFGLFEKLDPKAEGTGMGLALVRRIVELYEGQIWVESAGLGQGSNFLFTLPGAVIIDPEQSP